MNEFARLVDDFCATDWGFHPIDASFAGMTSYDAELPPADATSIAREIEEFSELRDRARTTPVPGDAGSRLDARLMDAQIAYRLKTLHERAPQHNPAYYTGEVAFSIVSHLLASPVERDPTHLAARIRAIPELLSGGATLLQGRPIPAGWVRRANAEIASTSRLLRDGLRKHPVSSALPDSDIEGAVKALHRFGGIINTAEETDPACGRDFLAFLLREVHGLEQTPETLERESVAAFNAVQSQLEEEAEKLDPGVPWLEQCSRLRTIGPGASEVLPSYALWHHRAMHDASELVTPAVEYALEFRNVPSWARDFVSDMDFLRYRAPAFVKPGDGSTYWIMAANRGDHNDIAAHNTAHVKLVGAVHHGSIGHHTQNTRARSAASRIARLAGTDGSMSIFHHAAGTMIEGWACYAETLLSEVPDFYTPAERLLVRAYQLRSIGHCIADVRLHCGIWPLDEVHRFYRDDLGFSPGQIWPEITRNSIFPTNALIMWAGTETIAALRAASPLPAKAFHDRLLSYGSAPIAWVAQELRREPAAASVA